MFRLFLLLLPLNIMANEVYVTMPASMQKSIYASNIVKENNGLVTIKTQEDYLPFISHLNHQKKNYCGGFIVTEGIPKGERPVMNFTEYSLTRGDLVRNYISQVDEGNLYNQIKKLSGYHTRYYKAREGTQAVLDLFQDWKNLALARSDIQVKLIQHKKWKQPSLMLTFKGSSNESVIIGGHVDSINTDDEGIHSHAPGADDNASGISVMTETIRVLIRNQYRSTHNLTFMAYAAEEVGLRGSLEIAGQFSDRNEPVKGVLQIDGTNFNGSRVKMVLINDNTDSRQNDFLGNLIDRYLKVPWGRDTCEYACSDHYSWTYNGYPASFPAEAYINEENPRIHTADDTLDVSGDSAAHSVHFAKLALAYVLELDK